MSETSVGRRNGVGPLWSLARRQYELRLVRKGALGSNNSPSASGGGPPCSASRGLAGRRRFGRALGTIAALTAVACGPRSAPQSPPTEATTRALGRSPTPEWVELGPKPIGPGGMSHGVGPAGDACSGATGNIIVHPTKPNIIFVVPQTGGVWRTQNGLDASPHWEPLTDAMPSSSIGALAMDPGNPDVLVAGTGTYTSYGDPDGGRVYVSQNGGVSWREVRDPLLFGKSHILQVNVRGNRILVGTLEDGFEPASGSTGGSATSARSGTLASPFFRRERYPANATIRSMRSDPSSPIGCSSRSRTPLGTL